MKSIRCPNCSSENLVPGELKNAPLFKPKGASFLTVPVTMSAHMCRDCGAITLLGDVDALRKLVKEDK